MISSPSLSIGMPVYNGEASLTHALDSILAQDYEDFELVISDNGSMDRTAEICRDYEAKDKRIRYYKNAINLGPLVNFQRVLTLSVGKYFMWAAHDDLWERDFVSKLIAVFQAHNDLALVCCDYDTIYNLTGSVEPHQGTVPQLSAEHSEFKNTVLMLKSPHSLLFYGIYSSDKLKCSKFNRLSALFDFYDLFVLNEMCLTGKVHVVPEILFHAGVKEAERTPHRFGGARIPGFKFSYKKYFVETVGCILKAEKLRRIEKFYLLQLITSQVTNLISAHEPVPNVFKQSISKWAYYSHRLTERFLLKAI